MAQTVIRFSQSARKHKIGRAHAMFVINNNVPVHYFQVGKPDQRCSWRGVDDRGLELEVVAVIKGETLLVIHVMPTLFRRGS